LSKKKEISNRRGIRIMCRAEQYIAITIVVCIKVKNDRRGCILLYLVPGTGCEM